MADLKKRSEVEKQDTWALEDLFISDAAWQEEFNKLKEVPRDLSVYRGRLSESAETLYEYYQILDQLDLRIDSLGNYAMRKHDEDTKNPVYQSMYGLMTGLFTEINSAAAFSLPELLAISDDTLGQFYEDKPELRLYERYFIMQRLKKEHILSEKEETILAMSAEMARGPSNIFGMMNNADLKFPSIQDENGNTLPLSHGTYTAYLENKNQSVRKEAFNSLYSVYTGFQNTFAETLNSQIKKLTFFAKVRNYENTLQAALAETEVPVDVYHNLLKVVSENVGLMHKYINLRKRLLALDELHMYDIYVPIVEVADSKVPYDNAKQKVYEAMAPLGEEYQKLIKEGFDNRWIDVYENEGKRSGAYSAGAKVHPYVLLNYNDTIDSQFTLAHEMGHALHSYLSNHTQPIVYSEYKIFVAEVASTFNEALLMRHLLGQTQNRAEKAYLINHFLEGFRGTFFRQTMFAEFELMINQTVESGESLTADKLKKMYHELNVKYYGEDIIIDEYIDVEWAKIPHFYYNFYVYQYATGYAAAIALSNKILEEGKPAVDNYLKFLSMGSSKDPIALLKIAGVDMSTADPIRQALKVFSSLIDEMEALLEE